jgi:HEAT repeat protein
MYQYNLNPETGPDNMRFLAGIKNEETRMAAETALLKGKSPDMVKTAIRQKPEEDPRDRLSKEKLRLERTIASLTKRLEEVEHELEAIEL